MATTIKCTAVAVCIVLKMISQVTEILHIEITWETVGIAMTVAELIIGLGELYDERQELKEAKENDNENEPEICLA